MKHLEAKVDIHCKLNLSLGTLGTKIKLLIFTLPFLVHIEISKGSFISNVQTFNTLKAQMN